MTGQDHERTTISYQAVPPGLPVITHDGEQFGVVEHVLQVPGLDLFDGIVVYTGASPAGRPPGLLAELLSRADHHRVAQLQAHLRFVDADQVEAITPAHIRCSFGRAQAGLLPAPQGPPAYHVNLAAEQDASIHARIGRMFRRAHWTPDR